MTSSTEAAAGRVRSSVLRGPASHRATMAGLDDFAVSPLWSHAANEARTAGYADGHATGYADGRAEGWSAGLAAAEQHVATLAEELAARATRAWAALAGAAQAFDRRQSIALEGLADAIVAAAVELAETIVCREVAGGDVARAVMATSLQAAPPGEAHARLHPDD